MCLTELTPLTRRLSTSKGLKVHKVQKGGAKPPRISRVRLFPGSLRDVQAGLLGYVSLVLDDAIELDGLTLRRTRGGRPALSFPARRDREGREHHYIRPLNGRVRREIERQVLHELLGEEVA